MNWVTNVFGRRLSLAADTSTSAVSKGQSDVRSNKPRAVVVVADGQEFGRQLSFSTGPFLCDDASLACGFQAFESTRNSLAVSLTWEISVSPRPQARAFPGVDLLFPEHNPKLEAHCVVPNETGSSFLSQLLSLEAQPNT